MFTKTLIFVAIVAICSAEDKYSSQYDNFDIDAFVKDAARLKAFKECVIGNGECTPLGTSFKKDFPDALSTNCAKCSAAQKVLLGKLVKALKTNYSEEFIVSVKKIDPELKNWVSFEKSITA